MRTPSMLPRSPAVRQVLGLLLLVGAVGGGMQLMGAFRQARLGPQVAAAARPGDIQMIGSVTCVYCAAARAWFDAHRVPFSECEIERDARCAAAYAAFGAPGTPVLLVRGRRLVGFDAQAVADALHAAPEAQ
jgi:glutaredoxin